MRRLVVAVCVIAGLGCVVSAPAGAETITFGADLSLAPDLSFHCPLAPPFFGPYALPATCTAFTSGVFGGGSARASHLVPAGRGAITTLRLREPNAVSSPLVMTVLQAIRAPQSPIDVCCTVVSQSRPFTPTPGAITTVTFNPPIQVHAITTATGVYEFQAVALTATDANSIIPAGTAAGHSSGAYYPAALPGQERYEQMTSLGTSTQILFDVDEQLDPAVAFSSGRFTPGSATVPLVCRLTTACAGTLVLRDTTPTHAAAKVYGRARFAIAAGRRGSIRVALTSLGRRLVAGRLSVKLYATTTVGGHVVSKRITLRR